ncbi:MAG: UDP-N-acetylmuramoylalanyl-D-glutamate--2,6-diaminopimelate ligase, partial [Phycisphaerae bacterium]
TGRTAESAVAAGLAAEVVTRYGEVSEAAAEAPSIVWTGDVVLVKGSRAMQMEQVADAIADALR